MASRAFMAREIPEIVVATMEALVKYGVFMVSIALAYAVFRRCATDIARQELAASRM